jgi:hypothetical protein
MRLAGGDHEVIVNFN